MAVHTRFLYGGGGAIVPVLLNFLVIDLTVVFNGLTLLTALSYVLRVCALFAAGGLVVTVFNRDEVVPAKLFQLGIVAPALLTALINGHNAAPQGTGGNGIALAPPAPAHAAVTWHIPSFIGEARAQTPPSPPSKLKAFALPQETQTQQIYRGLFGSTQKNIWFVIVGSHRTENDAQRQASQLRTRKFDAEVYAPWGDNPYYAVVIGAQLTLAEAQNLRTNAVRAGLPPDAYLWTIPRP